MSKSTLVIIGFTLMALVALVFSEVERVSRYKNCRQACFPNACDQTYPITCDLTKIVKEQIP